MGLTVRVMSVNVLMMAELCVDGREERREGARGGRRLNDSSSSRPLLRYCRLPQTRVAACPLLLLSAARRLESRLNLRRQREKRRYI